MAAFLKDGRIYLWQGSYITPSIFPSIRVFFNESALRIKWPKYRSLNFSISPSSEYAGLISFGMDWVDLFAAKGTLKSPLQHHSLQNKWKSFSCVWLSATPWTIQCTVHGNLQARILEWVAFPFSRGSSQPRDWTQASRTAGRFFISWATRGAEEYWSG